MSPNNCWLANTVITIQSVYALLLNAVVLGIVFARVSRPGQRVSFTQIRVLSRTQLNSSHGMLRLI